MVTPDLFQEMVEGKKPAFILTSGGRVQLYDVPGKGPAMVVATSRQSAEKLASSFSRSKKIVVAEIGTVAGETLAGQLATAVAEAGAVGAFVTDDGIAGQLFSAPGRRDHAS